VNAVSARQIPLLDLQAQHRAIREEVLAEIVRVVDSQKFILGDEVQKLEAEIAAYSQAKFGIGCASGSDALMLALMALGVWMLSAALGVWMPNMRAGTGRWLLAGGWAFLLATLGCAFFAWQHIETWSASDQLLERTSSAAERAAPWLLLIAIALSGAALLVAL
jgi:hypothetical protein